MQYGNSLRITHCEIVHYLCFLMLIRTLIISSLATVVGAEKREAEERAIHHTKSHLKSASMQPRIVGGEVVGNVTQYS